MIYRVTGKRPYLDQKPGTVFVATLDPEAERRAVSRGDIEIIDRSPPTIDKTRVRLPETTRRPPREGA